MCSRTGTDVEGKGCQWLRGDPVAASGCRSLVVAALGQIIGHEDQAPQESPRAMTSIFTIIRSTVDCDGFFPLASYFILE
jgi:hypothetical protein